MKKTAIAAMIALGALATPAAHAAFVSVWDYSVTTVFNTGVNAPTFAAGRPASPGPGTPLWDASSITWGATGGTLGSSGTLNTSRSGLFIEGVQPQVGSIITGSLIPQDTATFSHINNPISNTFRTLLTATIDSTLTLTPNTPSGPALPPQAINFDIQFAETPNSAGNCVVGATSVCDDVFVVTFGSLNQQFDYDGFTYSASILKTDGPLDPLSPSACAAAGADAGCLGFLTREGEKTSVDFGIVITATPVRIPEPGILALVGLGLAGMGLVSRRRRQA